MEKHNYWTSVSTFEIVPEEESNNQEFEIEATKEELNELEELYLQLENIDNKMFLNSANPASAYENSYPRVGTNPNYDDGLKMVYQMIYKLGKPRTKEHIKSMNIM